MKPWHSAFTLIELLVVISIIAILAGLSLAGMGSIQFRAKQADTVKRIEGLIAGLSARGEEGGSVCALVQSTFATRGAPLGGTADWAHFGTVPVPPSAVVAGKVAGFASPEQVRSLANQQQVWDAVVPAWHKTWPEVDDPAKPLVLPYPWGKRRAYKLLASWYTTPLTLPSGPTFTAAEELTWASPEPHGLGDLRPHHAFELAWAAGIITSDWTEAKTLYFSDRSPKRTWNDRWGRPLVAACALFQPAVNNSTTDRNATYVGSYDNVGRSYESNRVANMTWSRHLLAALSAYQYNRSLYLAVAAAGPRTRQAVPTTTAEADVRPWITSLWSQAADVCQDGGKTWNENSFDNPPWTGIRAGRKTVGRNDERCLLSAPVELK